MGHIEIERKDSGVTESGNDNGEVAEFLFRKNFSKKNENNKDGLDCTKSNSSNLDCWDDETVGSLLKS